MSTKAQLQDTIETLSRSSNKYYEMWQQEKRRADELQLAVDQKFADLEVAKKDAYWATQCAVWTRNDPLKNAVATVFKSIVEWAGRNNGYGDDDEEKQATGLGGLVYIRANIEPSFAVRFAAEVCEQHNYHGECARLIELYEEITQPPVDQHPPLE